MSKSPFLQLISDTMFERRYAKRTIETYLTWIKGYIYFHQKKHPIQMGNIEVEAYLNHLALKNDVAVMNRTAIVRTVMYRTAILRGKAINFVDNRFGGSAIAVSAKRAFNISYIINTCADAYRHPARRPHGFVHTASLLYDLLFAYFMLL